MKILVRSFFSIACAVVLLMSMAAPAFAVDYFVPSVQFPTSADLPFGYNCIVVDFTCQYVDRTRGFWRFFAPSGTQFMVQHVSSHYEIDFVFSTGNAQSQTNSIWVQAYNEGNQPSGSLDVVHAVYDSSTQAEIAHFESSSVATRYFQLFSNYSAYSDNGVSYINSELKLYPSGQNQIVSRVNENVDRAVTSLNAEEQSRHQQEMTQASQNHAEDISQRSRQHAEDISQRSAEHSEILNIGNDGSTLDTDNGWMDDSLSKVNGWLDDLSGFESQMSANRADNAENMQEAGYFLSDFFNSVPAALIASMALCLVVIVVVKIVGR